MDTYNEHRRQALRIERDQSWTIYHVFTGVPVRIGARRLIDLSIAEATDGMLSLNRRNALRRKERTGSKS
ncbi:hypothetical protein ACQZ46_24575 [Agrobacterium salinitolerans]